MDNILLMKEFLRLAFDHPVVIRKAKIIRCDISDYTATVQILKNDGSVDETFPEIPKVDIPIIWGRNGCGVFCPPEKGSLCDVMFVGGDINFPVINSIRGNKHTSIAEDGEFIIKNQTSSIKITPDCIEIDGDVIVNGSFHVDGDITTNGTNPNQHIH